MNRPLPHLTRALALAFVLHWSGQAAAQQAAPSVEIARFRPTTPVNRGFGVEGARPLPRGAWGLALDLDHASHPLQVRADPGGEFQLLERALSANLLMALGFGSRFEVALALPVVLSQAGDALPGMTSPPGGGPGDARLTVKALLTGPEPRGFSLATSLTVSAPMGSGALINDGGFGAEPRLIAEHQVGRWQVGGRVGYRLRPSPDLLGTDVGNQLSYGVGGRVRLGRSTRLIAEVDGATPANGNAFKKRRTPVEALVGVRHQFGRVFVTAGAGAGLVPGFGAPTWRGLLSVGWATVGPDSDRDGVEDRHDQCLDVPEDRDNFEDSDGCPDPDNDGDGLLDAQDKCPLEAEDQDEFEDEDGCPDPDNDGDGVADADDKCPDEPETANDWEDEDGCPDEVPTADEDKDGIPDVDDACPKEAEDKDGFEDQDGCPDLDNDKDGVPDAADKCPSEAETINGNNDEDGCPDAGKPQVRIGTKELETMEHVFFATDRARVRRRFHRLLDQVALTMKAHDEVGRCAVEGHTDSTGPEDWNQTLSLKRADAVVTYLVKRGVAPSRLLPIGQGAAMPWAENETEEGRAKNRRVVFHIEGVDRSIKPRPLRKRRSHEERAAARVVATETSRDQAAETRRDQAAEPGRAPAVKAGTPPRGPEAVADPRRPAPPTEPAAQAPGGAEGATDQQAPSQKAATSTTPGARRVAPPEDDLEGKSLRDLIKLPPQ